MFTLNKITRTFRSPEDAPSSGFGGSTTHPFAAAGDNVFDQMAKNKPSNDASNNGMQAPTMENGMPKGTNPPPLESMSPNNSPQWSPQQSPQNPQQAPQQAPQQSPQQQAPQPQQQSGSPLDIYNPVKDNGINPSTQQPVQQPQQAPVNKSVWDTDMKGWEKATANVDLAVGITPEQVQEAMQDPNKMMAVIQQVARTAMNQAAYMSTRVAGVGVGNSIKDFGGTIPNMINDHQFQGMWKGDGIMNHQSAQPMVTALTSQFRTQFPDASPSQIQEQVKHYMQTFAQSMTSQQQQLDNPNVDDNQGTDISNFFS